MFLWKGSLERDPQVMCKNMLVAGRVLRQAHPPTTMTIDRDHPPDCTHLSKLRCATGQLGQPLLPPCRASCSVSPGRYIISAWAERIR